MSNQYQLTNQDEYRVPTAKRASLPESVRLLQPVKCCRAMNNNAGKLFHYRITVSPPTNFLVMTFFCFFVIFL